MARDRNAMRERLMGRLQTGGLGTGFNLPLKAGTNLWTPENGSHIIDIMPYIAGPDDPNVQEGDETYILELFVHQNIGVAGEGMRICLQNTYGKPCPACEDRVRRQREGEDEKVIKALTPSRYPRTLYDVIVGDTQALINEGHKVFHTSFWLLEMYLREMARRVQRPGDRKLEAFIPFMALDNGKSVAFKKEGEKDKTKFIGIRFEDRDYDYGEEELEKAYCLDQVIIKPTYDDMLLWYYGEEGQPEGSFRTGRTRGVEENQGGRIPRGSAASQEETGRRSEPEQETGRRRRGSEPEPEKQPEPAPEGTGRRRRDHEPEPEKNPCPFGYRFGEDLDSKKECNDCEEKVWQDCTKEANRLKDEAKKKKEEEEAKSREQETGRRRGGSVEEPAQEETGRRRRSVEETQAGGEPEGGRRRRGSVEDVEPQEESGRRRRG